MRVNVVDPIHCFGMLDRLDVEIDDHRFLTAPYDDALQLFIA